MKTEFNTNLYYSWHFFHYCENKQTRIILSLYQGHTATMSSYDKKESEGNFNCQNMHAGKSANMLAILMS